MNYIVSRRLLVCWSALAVIGIVLSGATGFVVGKSVKKSKPRPFRFVESAAERDYEDISGREIVHRKDGSTYERWLPGRRSEHD